MPRHTLRPALLVVLLLVCVGTETTRGQAADAQPPAHAPRVALFAPADFPTVDAPAVPDAAWAAVLDRIDTTRFASTQEMLTGLKFPDQDVLVLPHGSAFPVGAWPAIRAFLDAGGGLVVLGGAPFHQPVREVTTGGKPGWELMTRQPTYAHELLIGPAEAIAINHRSPAPTALPDWTAPVPPAPQTVWTLTVRFTTQKDFPGEDGTSGPRDALLRPLVRAGTPNGADDARPIIEIDRLRGRGAGGRWVLAPCDAALGNDVIRAMITRALAGVTQLEARPVFARVDPGEPINVRITLRRPNARAAAAAYEFDNWAVTAMSPDGRGQTSSSLLRGPASTRTTTVSVRFDAALRGLVDLHVSVNDGHGAVWNTSTAVRIALRKELFGGPPLSVSRDWIRRDGQVFPVIGTTYMASDVHRKYLFEPDPATWDRDFAAMEAQGINLVRTGLWTAWDRVMVDAGAVDEGVLRALDAFVLTAQAHNIVVCFNFFAFRPPLCGGVNPYLDPRAIEGQRALLTAVASRYRESHWIHYDLINEPSYAPAEFLWTTRPMGDMFEARAWRAWAIARHGDDPLVLRDRWRDAGDDVYAVPTADDLKYSQIRDQRKPRKGADFIRFTNDVVMHWAADHRETLRATAGTPALVTLGEDEGGAGLRPGQQFLAPALDYTSIHTWWNNDDLLWDGVVTKVPEKPSLIQETGLMRLEDMDGMPWRTPDEAACLLERKFALAFAARGCGAVQWAWNVNPYMPIDNEAVIGIMRPDGTAKPELRVIKMFADFFKTAAPYLDDYDPDQFVMLLPHARLFAGRPKAMEVTKRLVRGLATDEGIVPTAMSDERVTAARLAGARGILVPVPEMMSAETAGALKTAADAGATVWITGAVDGDAYGAWPAALTALGLTRASRAVAFTEPQPGYVLHFEEGCSEWLRGGSEPRPAMVIPGVFHLGPPLEASRELTLPAVSIHGVSVRHPASRPTPAQETTRRVLATPKALFVVVVDEGPVLATRDATIARLEVTIAGKLRKVSVPVEPGRTRLVLLDRADGRIIASTPGDTITLDN